MKMINIYWFSGTGNSLKIAKTLDKSFKKYFCDSSITSMTSINPENINTNSLVGLVFPVAVQSTYPLVWEFINNMPDVNGTKIFMADTMSVASGGIVGPLKKVLTKKDIFV